MGDCSAIIWLIPALYLVGVALCIAQINLNWHRALSLTGTLTSAFATILSAIVAYCVAHNNWTCTGETILFLPLVACKNNILPLFALCLGGTMMVFLAFRKKLLRDGVWSLALLAAASSALLADGVEQSVALVMVLGAIGYFPMISRRDDHYGRALVVLFFWHRLSDALLIFGVVFSNLVHMKVYSEGAFFLGVIIRLLPFFGMRALFVALSAQRSSSISIYHYAFFQGSLALAIALSQFLETDERIAMVMVMVATLCFINCVACAVLANSRSERLVGIALAFHSLVLGLFFVAPSLVFNIVFSASFVLAPLLSPLVRKSNESAALKSPYPKFFDFISHGIWFDRFFFNAFSKWSTWSAFTYTKILEPIFVSGIFMRVPGLLLLLARVLLRFLHQASVARALATWLIGLIIILSIYLGV